MYKLLTSSKRSDDLSIGFHRDRGVRRSEMTNNKNVKGNYHLRIMLRDVFGLVEGQEKATYGLGYKLTLTRNKDDVAFNKIATVADARIKIDHIHWIVPLSTPSVQQQSVLSNQILSKTTTELRSIERSVFYERSE